jgi:hypothetical protein
MEGYDWAGSTAGVDWNELSMLYRIAPLGTPSAAELETIYGNCMFASFAYAGLGFLPMNTAMAIWRDPAAAVSSGLLRAAQD